MCEMLVRAVDNTHKDPDKDRMTYKRHMPVLVMEDGNVWTEAERSNRFYVVKIPGVPKADMQKYCEPEWLEISLEPEIYRRREWHVDETQLDGNQLSDIDSKGEFSLETKEEADNIMSRVGG